jgi:hypothetical protein
LIDNGEERIEWKGKQTLTRDLADPEKKRGGSRLVEGPGDGEDTEAHVTVGEGAEERGAL